MAKVDPCWSLDTLLRNYDPHSDWRSWFTEAYTKAFESYDPEERIDGWRTAAIILGDMHANVLCLFVCYHGQNLEPPGDKRFLGHIDLCLWELGLATPTQVDAAGTVPSENIGKPDGFRRDTEGTREWLAEQLRPFEGDVERAAVFAMRLTAARFGLLRGPVEPSVAQVLDESLWSRVRSTEQAIGKRWWFWR